MFAVSQPRQEHAIDVVHDRIGGVEGQLDVVLTLDRGPVLGVRGDHAQSEMRVQIVGVDGERFVRFAQRGGFLAFAFEIRREIEREQAVHGRIVVRARRQGVQVTLCLRVGGRVVAGEKNVAQLQIFAEHLGIGRERTGVRKTDGQGERIGDGLRNVLLHGENIAGGGIVILRPDRAARGRLDQTQLDAQLVTGFAQAAFERMRGVQFGGQLRRVEILFPRDGCRNPGNQAQAADAGQSCRQFFAQAGGKSRLVLVIADHLQRQHDKGR